MDTRSQAAGTLPAAAPTLHPAGGPSSPPSPTGAPRVVAVVVEPFALWLAERRTPELARAPLVVCEEGRVRHANPAARRHGIDLGMRLAGARMRAPALVVTPGEEPDLADGWRGLVRELLGWTPWLEAGRRGRAFLRIGAREAETLAVRLRARVGVADDVEMAELAALGARPGRARTVPPGGGAAFLARLPLRFLRGVGLGEADLIRLQWLGIATASDLATWSAAQLRAYLGEPQAAALLPYLHGPRRARLANARLPQVLRRSLAFERPLFEPADLEPALDDLSRALAVALRGRAARHVTVATEGGGGPRRASRLAKRPLRAAGQIRQQALFALRDTGAAAHGVEGLALELAAPERLAEEVGLWDAARQRATAADLLLERFPHALSRVVWDDPHAPAGDLAWHWAPLEDAAGAPPATAAPRAPARARRRGPAQAAQTLLAALPGALPPAVQHASPPTIPAPAGDAIARPGRSTDVRTGLPYPAAGPADPLATNRPAPAEPVTDPRHDGASPGPRPWARPAPHARAA